jgi:hypothetical protein
MEIWAQCAQNVCLSVQGWFCATLRKTMQFVKTSDFLTEILMLDLLNAERR